MRSSSSPPRGAYAAFAERGLHDFDAWASTFVNVPELIAMFRTFADVVMPEDLRDYRYATRTGAETEIELPVTTTPLGAIAKLEHVLPTSRRCHILVDTPGLPIANRVEAADISDRRAGALLTGGLKKRFSLRSRSSSPMQVTKARNSPALWQSSKVAIADRQASSARLQDHWLDLDRRAQLRLVGTQSSARKDYEYRVQTSETMIDIASTRLMLNRLVPG